MTTATSNGTNGKSREHPVISLINTTNPFEDENGREEIAELVDEVLTAYERARGKKKGDFRDRASSTIRTLVGMLDKHVPASEWDTCSDPLRSAAAQCALYSDGLFREDEHDADGKLAIERLFKLYELLRPGQTKHDLYDERMFSEFLQRIEEVKNDYKFYDEIQDLKCKYAEKHHAGFKRELKRLFNKNFLPRSVDGGFADGPLHDHRFVGRFRRECGDPILAFLVGFNVADPVDAEKIQMWLDERAFKTSNSVFDWDLFEEGTKSFMGGENPDFPDEIRKKFRDVVPEKFRDSEDATCAAAWKIATARDAPSKRDIVKLYEAAFPGKSKRLVLDFDATSRYLREVERIVEGDEKFYRSARDAIRVDDDVDALKKRLGGLLLQYWTATDEERIEFKREQLRDFAASCANPVLKTIVAVQLGESFDVEEFRRVVKRKLAKRRVESEGKRARVLSVG